MSNTIKLKRGSGSDPGSSDLVVGELAIRTDLGKIFLKKDNGNIAEVSGGGGVADGDKGEITVSNSGDTWVIDNNVIDEANLKISNSPTNGYFLQAQSGNTGGLTWAEVDLTTLSASNLTSGTIPAARIGDDSIVNAKINSSAAIAGTKISPNFGSQNVDTSGSVACGNITIANVNPKIFLTDTNNNSDYSILNNNGIFNIKDDTNTATRFYIEADGSANFTGNLDCEAGLDVTGNLTVDTSTLKVDSSNNRVGIGRATPGMTLDVYNSTNGSKVLRISHPSDPSNAAGWFGWNSDGSGTTNNIFTIGVQYSSSYYNVLNIKRSTQTVGINNDNPSQALDVTGNIAVSGTVDGVDIAALNTAAARKDGTNMGATTLTVNDADFIVQDSTDSVANFIWRDHGNSQLKIGTADAVVTPRSSVIPSADSTYDLGANGTRWANIYGDNIYGDGSNLTSLPAGQLTGTIAAARLDTATTQSAGNNSTKIATTAYTDTAISNLVDSSPSALNTLNELAAALGDDANFSTTVTNSIATKLPLAGGTLTGALTGTSATFTGNVSTGHHLTVSGTEPRLQFTDSNNNSDFTIWANAGLFQITDATNSADRLKIDSSGSVFLSYGALYLGTADSSSGHLNAYESMTFNLDTDNDDTNRYFAFYKNGAAGSGTELFKIEESGNVTVTGTLTARDINPDGDNTRNIGNGTNNYASIWASTRFRGNDGVKLVLGSSQDFIIHHSVNANLIEAPTNHSISINTGTGDNADKTSIHCAANGGAVDLRFADSAKLTTSNTGVTVSGTCTATTFSGSGASLTNVNATTLDSIDSGSFLRSDADDTATGQITFSGSGATAGPIITSSNAAGPKLSINSTASGGKHWMIISNASNNTDGAGYLQLWNSTDSFSPVTFGATSGTATEFRTGIEINNNTVWHAGNDGSGSGLDADTVDGIEAASFLRSDASDTFTGTLTLNNVELSQLGSTTQNLKVKGNNTGGSTDAGISLFNNADAWCCQLYGTNNGSTTTYGFLAANWGGWDLQKAVDGHLYIQQGGALRTVWHANNDGTGSGLDADLLDGKHDTSFLRSDAGGGAASYNATSDITFSGGAGAATIEAGSDIRFTSGNWTGDAAAKIQNHGNWLYIAGGTAGISFRMNSGQSDYWYIENDGTFRPATNNNVDIGDASHLVNNAYLNWVYTNSGDRTDTIPTRFFASDDQWLRYYDINHMKMYLDGSYKTNGYTRRGYTTDKDYWVGASTSGTVALNDCMGRGNIWFDTWSNPSGQPSGTSHWTGFNCLHYTNRGDAGDSSGGAYGWQMMMGAGNASLLYVRGEWTSSNLGSPTWYKVWNESNDGSGSGLDADLLDGQQGSYYLDYNNLSNKPSVTTALYIDVYGSGNQTSRDTARNWATSAVSVPNNCLFGVRWRYYRSYYANNGTVTIDKDVRTLWWKNSSGSIYWMAGTSKDQDVE